VTVYLRATIARLDAMTVCRHAITERLYAVTAHSKAMTAYLRATIARLYAVTVCQHAMTSRLYARSARLYAITVCRRAVTAYLRVMTARLYAEAVYRAPSRARAYPGERTALVFPPRSCYLPRIGRIVLPPQQAGPARARTRTGP